MAARPENTLFRELPAAAHPYYRALFEGRSEHNRLARETCDVHWGRFRHLADRNFAARFPFEFHQRWFEMYLGATLLDLGLAVSASKPGPDFCVTFEGRTNWFE